MKLKIFLIITFCSILVLCLAILNSITIPLCIINGLILYELWKINEHLDKMNK